ncbi:MAG: thiamine phosphate synthase [Proteobacteria bacterium]|nr:thiamine phosphate synthase [Pseudomonadota bacterium]
MNSKSKPLYLISDGGYLRKENKLVSTLETVIRSGHDIISHLQIREQNPAAAKAANIEIASDDELLVLCNKLKPICLEFGIKLIINRNIKVAKEAEVDGVHLGVEGDILGSKNILGSDKIVGGSTHQLSEILTLNDTPVDYCFFSPVFKPLSKVSTLILHGVENLKIACATAKMDIYALGGITADNFSNCLNNGAKGVALISAIILANDPLREIQEFRAKLEK